MRPSSNKTSSNNITTTEQQKPIKKIKKQPVIQHRRIIRFDGGWPFPDKNSSHWFLVDDHEPPSDDGNNNSNEEERRKAADTNGVIRKKRQLMWEQHSWKKERGGYMGITFDNKAAYDAFLVYVKKFVPPQLQW